MAETRKTRPVSWSKAALKEFGKAFKKLHNPSSSRRLRSRRTGDKADIAKPMHGLGEIALAFRGDAFRVVHALQLANEVWVIHASKRNRSRYQDSQT